MEKGISEKIFFDVCVLCFVVFTDVFATEPSFDVPTINVTVVEGEDATLPCSVENLQEHTVVWSDQFSTLLTYGTTRILDDDRISVERPYTEDWNLLIREVKYEDNGKYICQINTRPVKTKYVALYVLVPPKVISSTSDVVTREGETVTLVCNVTGVPPPRVQWYRQPLGQSPGKQKERLDSTERSSIGPCTFTTKRAETLPVEPRARRIIGPSIDNNGEIGTHGEILIIHNVSRYCEGKYECLCFNGVKPAVKRDMNVQVEFRPEIELPNKRIGQYQGKDTILECKITAFPQAVTVWKRYGKELTSDFKYHVEVYELGSHRLTLSLRIKNINSNDFGSYSCFSSNKLGEDQEEMILYEYFQRTTGRPTFRTESYPIRTHRLPDNPYDHDTKIQGSIQGPLIVTKGTQSSLESQGGGSNSNSSKKRYRNSAYTVNISMIRLVYFQIVVYILWTKS